MARQDEAPPRPTPAQAAVDPLDALDAVILEYETGLDAFYEGFSALETDAEREAYSMKREGIMKPFADRIWAIADADPSSKAALKATVWIVNNQRNTANITKGVGILGAHFTQSEEIAEVLGAIAGNPSPSTDAFLRRVLAETPHHAVKGEAMYALCSELGMCSSMQSTLSVASEEELAMYSDWFSPEALAFIRSADLEKAAAERGRLLEALVKDYADVAKYGQSLSDLASAELYELQHLQIGMVAPEIEDTNLDGENMKLSDFRGKVVMLDFWGDW